MGPFGTVVVVPMFPELRTAFGASASAVGLSFSLYLIPFAALLLVSGTLGERWGRRRTVRATYLLYAATSIACALAPTLGVLIAARAAQGVANAFITPLLMAELADRVPSERFGRAAGIYASFQALGSAAGPLVGGLAADSNWKFAFFGSAIIAGLLALFPPPAGQRVAAVMPSMRQLVDKRLLLLAVSFFFGAAGPIGIAVLVGIVARDVLELSGTTAGLILMFSSLAAVAVGPVWGGLVDRLGPRQAGLIATAAATLAAAATAFPTGAWSLGLVMIATGAAISFVNVVYQSIGATIRPDNRGGALSFMLSLRFAGHAVGPIMFIPLIGWSARTALLLAASLGLIMVALTAVAAPHLAASDPPLPVAD